MSPSVIIAVRAVHKVFCFAIFAIVKEPVKKKKKEKNEEFFLRNYTCFAL